METQYKREEIKDYLADFIINNVDWLKENNPNDWKDELHFYAFNEDYYLIGRYQAKEWLADEVFNVIETIKEYEQSNFGEIYTDFSDPERVVTMYAYIVGEELVADYLNES